jgi:hypothetical protein
MNFAFAAKIFVLCLKQSLFETDHVIRIRRWQRRTAHVGMRLTDCRGNNGERSQLAMIAAACPSATTSSSFIGRDVIMPRAGEDTGISIFMASPITISSPSATVPPTCTGVAQTHCATSVTHLNFWHAIAFLLSPQNE